MMAADVISRESPFRGPARRADGLNLAVEF
jgi:hypothetical protein